jgi:hypothetical protein
LNSGVDVQGPEVVVGLGREVAYHTVGGHTSDDVFVLRVFTPPHPSYWEADISDHVQVVVGFCDHFACLHVENSHVSVSIGDRQTALFSVKTGRVDLGT